PFSTSSGSWHVLINNVTKSMEADSFNFYRPKAGFAVQMDATAVNADAAIPISTDPPYYDNIGYADLSDFFYIWLRASLKDVYPSIFSTLLVPETPELIASPHRHAGDSEAANQHFESG